MMTAQIPKSTLVLFCVLAFVIGLGGYTGFHFATASENSSQEVQDNSDSENDGDDGSNRTIILERESPAPQETEASSPVNNSGDYLLYDSAMRQYSSSELERLDNYQLYLARNEIFARHGRTFRNASLNEYFMQKSWYTPMYSPDEFDALDGQVSLLNDYEKYNANLMLEIEKARNSPYLQ